MTYLVLTVRFLDDRYHGLLDRNGPPEWPPSPFRLFQALVAGVARRGELDSPIGEALGALQKLPPPVIIAPQSQQGQGITRFVPNNDGDKKFDRQERLTAKITIPTLMLGKPEVYYLWDISKHPALLVEDRIRDAARSLTTLGWGIDMAFADARMISEADAQKLEGIRWHPKPGEWRNEGMLRTPTFEAESKQCSLCDLRHCHDSAMKRIEHGKPLHTVDKPKVFDRVLYSSTERPIGRPYALFALRTPDDDFYRYPHAKLIHIAGMLRHAAIEKMKIFAPQDVPPNWVETFVAGHRPKDVEDHKQFSYIPLPSIRQNNEPCDAMIRRVMIVAPFGEDRVLQHLADQLDGAQLIAEYGQNAPRLEYLKGDAVTQLYVNRTSKTWASVTPVILPGHDEHKPERAKNLILKALAHSGIEQPCKFTWSALPYFKNAQSAYKYSRHTAPDGTQQKQFNGFFKCLAEDLPTTPSTAQPNRLTNFFRPKYLADKTAVHLRLQFDMPVAGPLAVGSGRHCGLGVFAIS